ncbi:esterase-like activity of phytase family protein [Paracoccus aurantiacus]|uniref:Esterase-like activity of phytase family protein n=1 Tax=Paracoccus aurantiacus TaxID=2599412 RepID=A0A5C6RVM6_9RHOB|nr:esterase-like activity of phytase family protein [Paracoccus aurantiacus]TXB66411.1 esterase-like activity of phytase family protein [Paracoccus aurantiacus]
MSGRRYRALIAAVLVSACSGSVSGAARVEYVGSYVWSLPDADFGGFSGIEISDDGAGFHVLSDRAWVRWGNVERDNAGRIRGLSMSGRAQLQDSEGQPLKPGRLGDSEGLAIGRDGVAWVSFEGLNRIARYDDFDRPARRVPVPPEWRALQTNEGFEALAIDAAGDLLTLPEYAPEGGDFPVWRFHDGKWDQPFTIPADPGWQAVGADIGPDGRLYLLERNFRGILGFRSRVRRFVLNDGGVSGGETLLTSGTLQYDNLEGLAVWEDALGMRITMISDDNFLPVQRTELVEYRVSE